MVELRSQTMVKLNVDIKKKNSFFADAPIGKTRQAAIDGTLAIMVGSDLDTFKHLLPIFNLMGEDIMHCGDVGSGQLTKIMNNLSKQHKFTMYHEGKAY